MRWYEEPATFGNVLIFYLVLMFTNCLILHDVAYLRRHMKTTTTQPTIQPTTQPATTTRHMRVTAYCPCSKCCGRWADGITASGKPVTANGGRFVAADKTIPFGTLVTVPGYADGEPVPVLDRGGAIRGDRLDVFFLSHDEALEFGIRWLDVQIGG